MIYAVDVPVDLRFHARADSFGRIAGVDLSELFKFVRQKDKSPNRFRLGL